MASNLDKITQRHGYFNFSSLRQHLSQGRGYPWFGWLAGLTGLIMGPALAQTLPNLWGTSNRLILFDRPNQAGESLTLTRSATDLGFYNFDDRAMSIWVVQGRWQLCSEEDYRGSCLTFGPGEYSLGSLSNEVSSARQVEAEL